MKKYIIKDLKNIVLYIVISGISAGFASLIPWITSSFINNISQLNSNLIVQYLLGYVGAVLGILIFEYCTKLQGVRMQKNFLYSVRCDLFRGIMNMEYGEYSKEDSGYYVGVLTEDVASIYNEYFETVIGFLQNGIRIIVFFAVMFYLNSILSIVMLILAVISSIVPAFGGRKLATLRSAASKTNASYLTRIKELFSAFVVFNVKTKEAFTKRHDEACDTKQQALAKFERSKSFYEIFSGFFCYLINIGTFACGIILIWVGKLSVGEFVGLLSFIEVLIIPIQDFSYIILHYGASAEIKEKLKEIIDIKPKNDSDNKEQDFKEIKLSHVCFERNDFSMKDININFQKGRKYAIIGKSGSGKSTLLKLIYGILTPTSGEITVDGKVKSNFVLQDFAYIGQDTVIFQAGAVDNITVFGSYSDENLSDLVDKTNSKQLIREDFGEGGDKISGGEKNKIALLRALCEGKKALLCDEMFAALDKESKRIISDFLLTDSNYTVISITHDVTDEMLGYYDEIIVMEDGKVVGFGTYDELIKRC